MVGRKQTAGSWCHIVVVALVCSLSIPVWLYTSSSSVAVVWTFTFEHWPARESIRMLRTWNPDILLKNRKNKYKTLCLNFYSPSLGTKQSAFCVHTLIDDKLIELYKYVLTVWIYHHQKLYGSSRLEKLKFCPENLEKFMNFVWSTM